MTIHTGKYKVSCLSCISCILDCILLCFLHRVIKENSRDCRDLSEMSNCDYTLQLYQYQCAMALTMTKPRPHPHPGKQPATGGGGHAHFSAATLLLYASPDMVCCPYLAGDGGETGTVLSHLICLGVVPPLLLAPLLAQLLASVSSSAAAAAAARLPFGELLLLRA